MQNGCPDGVHCTHAEDKAENSRIQWNIFPKRTTKPFNLILIIFFYLFCDRLLWLFEVSVYFYNNN